MDIIERIDKMTIDEMGLNDIPSEFMNDPLYKKVLTAKNAKAQKKALDTLKSIRGPNALSALKAAMNPKSNRKKNVKFGGDTGTDADYGMTDEDSFAKTTARSTGSPTVGGNDDVEKRKKAYAAQKKKWAGK